MILAGDIGGTKTVLALYTKEDGVKKPLREEKYSSSDYDSLEAVIAEFLGAGDEKPEAASFGVAGPVVSGRAKVTNLSWTIEADGIRDTFGIPTVHLLNDLHAIAVAVPQLDADDLSTLNTGQRDPTGPIAIVAPGTGLGEAFLVWTGQHYQPCPTEGGHASFAPVTSEQLELLAHLMPRFGHVSYERVCSGSGIPNIYEYLHAVRGFSENDWLRKQLLKTDDPTPVIVNAALKRKSDLCIETLDLFVRILGGVVGNIAVKVLSTGGVYLGGGIPPRILPLLRRPEFMESISFKGRFSSFVADIPVHVILDSAAALHGAAYDGFAAAG